MEVDATAATPSTTTDAPTTSTPASPPSTPEADTYQTRLTKLKTILTAETPIHLNLEFLYHNNHTDMAILKNIKNAVETRNSVCHSATIFANAVMHAGKRKKDKQQHL
jgi:26S proteasome regulatory subunit N2